MNIKSFLNEFKQFMLKRNAIDMALGIILGISFGKVVSSLVNDIITPPIGLVLGGVRFPDLKIVLKHAVKNSGTLTQPEVAIHYGSFLQAIIDFFIIAFTAFVMVKAINRLIHRNDASLDWSEYVKK